MLAAGEVVSDAGIVESITLKNFMCHSLLGPFAFGSNVNFVVGNNGGKSAILTALIVALGGNAQATNRGVALKGFVKEGESAEVSITLRNKGRDAFKPDVYGSSITIDMRISHDGLRTYKLKSKAQVVTTKKDELLCILDNFNIQVNNPVSILTQEMSKYFLHSKGEGDKYQFFMKATQLEQMREDFVHIKSTKSVTEDKVEQHSEDLKRKYLEKEDRYKSLASLDEMHTKLEELQKQMAWALQVLEMEKELEPLKEKLGADKKSTKKYDEKVEEWKLTVHRCRANLRDLEKDKIQLSTRINDLKLISQTTGAESQARMEKIQQIKTEIENLRHQISTLGQQIDQYQHACGRAKEEQAKMESSRSNRLRRFGEHMPALLNAIQEAHRRGQFRHIPRGPLFLVSLKDPDHALAVEVCFKSLLLAFICDNHDDEKVLQGLMARVFPSGRRPTIITGVNHPEYPSVLQALEIEDPAVANCLIDQRGIETVLLIKNRTEARRVIQGRNPPQNCTQAFSKDGDQIFPNRSYAAEQQRANYLSGDVEEEIHLQRELENQTGQSSRFNRQLKKMDDDVRQNDSLLRRAHAEQRYVENKITKLQLELTDLQNVEEPQSEDLSPLKTDQEVLKCRHHKKHYDEKRAAHLNNIQTQENNLNSKENELEASIAKASEICAERLEVRRTARSLDTEINRLKVKISTQQEQQGDREEVQYHEALENYKNMAQQMKNLNSFIKSLDNVLNDRLQVYAELRFLSARCKYYFDSMLAQRGYTGTMTFNHKDETLSISVQPGPGNKADLSDMRSLSGGERSFSTVCFVLSLWAITEAPFRCLDEFDVYMDMVNRRISMDMMLKVAAGQLYRQFIFLTPQNMSLPVSKIIRVLRLKDPD
uniref:RecF/RecN/SMC N-terminal domain-containing protein n=1 Tax=Periophthalmus magnuspinnatus TaxID=409849 RepID=A0A3B4A2C9_9GOBI